MKERKGANIEQLKDGGFVVDLFGQDQRIYCPTIQVVAHEFRLYFGDGVQTIGVGEAQPPEDVT